MQNFILWSIQYEIYLFDKLKLFVLFFLSRWSHSLFIKRQYSALFITLCIWKSFIFTFKFKSLFILHSKWNHYFFFLKKTLQFVKFEKSVPFVFVNTCWSALLYSCVEFHHHLKLSFFNFFSLTFSYHCCFACCANNCWCVCLCV